MGLLTNEQWADIDAHIFRGYLPAVVRIREIWAHRRQTPDGIVQALFAKVGDFSGSQAQLDDFTAVIIKVEADA
jgi:hypothetical protein